MFSQDLLAGKVAVVAGSGAVGGATAHALAAAGANVVLLDRDADRLNTVGAELASYPGKSLAIALDLLDLGQLEGAVETITTELGTPQILVNVMGGLLRFAPHGHVHTWTDDNWDLIMDVNLRYVFRTCRAMIPAMIETGGGSIVNITSVAALNAAPGQGPYAAAKAAVASLTRTMALECGRYGIRVNAVAPGNIDHPASSVAALGSDVFSSEARIPLGRRATPEDIALAVMFFATPMTDYVTGNTVVVDGGSSLRFPLPLPGSHPTEAP